MAEFPKIVPADPKGVLTGRHFMDGDHALAEGALAAGCRFFAGYPITPSTETAERFAERCPEVGGLFIQMEDEIASITANHRRGLGRPEGDDRHLRPRLLADDGELRPAPA